ncbi:tRNA (adenosine(37)-N6)-threonylcarbamoyltransferase complex ATPase subunit type 1 TsaE [Flavobacterium agrisoli]|uniref:tRNA threonylcarbamoyladenosine biosynthesis protein TsaE n=1 Tax=Flavobacterium agrisoli TaxID=2793066 RepID=A0A934PKY2_9FLAO|nr:tRNA (adenosine(37)-N6)-threonylcarbamoyltransferase complex ATPase subunit type 1 TsaE [Flavobacterium agrisoli]MBK0368406.1 tRNA (adenosine(37)-N6)-threonylcarbamoyltransferase complex ATPase subunit type 1 TsaE [Flavobacterium agrisoli]
MEVHYYLDQINDVARQILEEKLEKIILFKGEMGAGKTTLIKALCQNLGVTDATSSPTFSLVNEYQTADGELIYHFDFYRLKQETEALDMGVEDYFYSGNWCFIEWSEKIPNLIPEMHTMITIESLADGKRILRLN